MEQKSNHTAGVIASPPLIVAAFLLIGLVGHWAFPLNITVHPWQTRLIIALPVLLLSGVLAGASSLLMRKHGTPVNPARPTVTIIERGPFRLSRNPMYLSLFLLYCGIVMALNMLVALLFFPLLFLIFRNGVVVREERYLEEKFGEKYLGYKQRVRRWI